MAGGEGFTRIRAVPKVQRCPVIASLAFAFNSAVIVRFLADAIPICIATIRVLIDDQLVTGIAKGIRSRHATLSLAFAFSLFAFTFALAFFPFTFLPFTFTFTGIHGAKVVGATDAADAAHAVVAVASQATAVFTRDRDERESDEREQQPQMHDTVLARRRACREPDVSAAA